jgi:hypothetical protein
VGKRSRDRAKQNPAKVSDEPFIELTNPENWQDKIYEVAPGWHGFDLVLHTAQAGGEITEISSGEPGAGINVTVGRPLLTDANRLLAVEPSAAVIRAHTASEIYIRHVMNRWAKVRGRPWPRPVRSYAFYRENKPLIAAYEELSEDRAYRRAPFWKTGRLTASVRRRNRVVHAGYVCSEDEARATIQVLNELHQHLEEVLQRLGVTF